MEAQAAALLLLLWAHATLTCTFALLARPAREIGKGLHSTIFSGEYVYCCGQVAWEAAMSRVLCWVCPSCGAWVSVDIQRCPGCGRNSPSTDAGRPHATAIPRERDSAHAFRIVFRVQGHAEQPYETVFEKDGDKVTARCTCPAGVKGRPGLCCKHRTRILRGNTDGIVSANIEEAKIVQGWVAGSDFEIAVQKLAQGETALVEARKKIAAAKRALAPIMNK